VWPRFLASRATLTLLLAKAFFLSSFSLYSHLIIYWSAKHVHNATCPNGTGALLTEARHMPHYQYSPQLKFLNRSLPFQWMVSHDRELTRSLIVTLHAEVAVGPKRSNGSGKDAGGYDGATFVECFHCVRGACSNRFASRASELVIPPLSLEPAWDGRSHACNSNFF